MSLEERTVKTTLSAASMVLVCLAVLPFQAAENPKPAAAGRPMMVPGPGDLKEARKVALKSASPDAVIRYTLDGTIPGPEDGLVYSAPLTIDKTTTLTAVAFQKDRAASPPSFGTYLVGPPIKPE